MAARNFFGYLSTKSGAKAVDKRRNNAAKPKPTLVLSGVLK
jgi:hypothetical protein